MDGRTLGIRNFRCMGWTVVFYTILSISNVFAEEMIITSSGSTFVYPLMSKWGQVYEKLTNTRLNYNAIGSGAGVKEIIAAKVDFAASDKPLDEAGLKRDGLTQFPIAIGGIVPVVNLPGVSQGQIKLSGEMLGDIFGGKISRWDDPAIVALNPKIKIPALPITIVYRKDSSGTTFIFSNYLSKVNTEWEKKIGNNTVVNWPTGTGVGSSQEVALYVAQTPGSIGYVEYIYSLQLNYISLKNKTGNFSAPSLVSFAAAAEQSTWSKKLDFGEMLTNAEGKDSWPIVGASFVIMHAKVDDEKKTRAMLNFFDWCYDSGNDIARQLNYVPIPEKVTKLIRQKWKGEIKTKNNAVIWKNS